MHANHADGKAHRFLDRGVNECQLIESSFGPFATVSFEHSVALFAQLGDKVCRVWRVEEVKESVCYGLEERVLVSYLRCTGDHPGRLTILVV